MKLTRRGRIALRGLPIAILAVGAFVVGVIAGSDDDPARAAAQRFAAAWSRQDFRAMYAELAEPARRRYSEEEFRTAYTEAAATATLQRVLIGEVPSSTAAQGRRAISLPVAARTNAFGEIRRLIALTFEGDGLAWQPDLVFPGLRPGERLERRTVSPPRAAILTRDGVALAAGSPSARTSPLGDAAAAISGKIGQPDPVDSAALVRAGFPADVPAGISGLEKAFNLRLAGRPGGELYAVAPGQALQEGRLLAKGAAEAAAPLKTTVDSRLQQAAVATLAGQPGGIAVLDARNGAVRALAGSAFSFLQPPGSTFKIVTAVAALEAKAVEPDDRFPFVKSANVGGREIANAHEEACGGTFVEAFAESCNSVFAPLGPKLGNDRLVATAERFGFNSQPTLYEAAATAAINPPASTIPEEIGSDLDLGVTAIGQGRLLTTPLQMASVAQTIAAGGVRSPTPIVASPSLQSDAKPVRVTSAEIAATVKRMMVAAVTSGTGHAAALAKIPVAGKTGTAELGPKPEEGELDASGEEKKQEVDAWFAAFAPANKPKLAVCVLLTGVHGDGGEVAAPLARQLLASALER